MKNRKKYLVILCLVLLFSLKIFPQNDLKLEKAYNYFEKENYSEALKIFLELDKNNYQAPQNTKNQIGLCYRNMGKIKEAIKWFKKALSESNNEAIQALIHTNLGNVYMIDGQKKIAKKHFLEADKLGILFPIEYKYEDEGWFYVCHAERDAIFYQPKTMKKKKGQIYRVWTKWVWDENRFNENDYRGMLGSVEDIERRKKEILKERRDIYYSIQLEDYDCNENKVRILSSTDYDINGKVLSSFDYHDRENNEGWNYIIPESIGENMINKICGK